eukprot:5800295-Pleurochrysis_carterae.AAC.4
MPHYFLAAWGPGKISVGHCALLAAAQTLYIVYCAKKRTTSLPCVFMAPRFPFKIHTESGIIVASAAEAAPAVR